MILYDFNVTPKSILKSLGEGMANLAQAAKRSVNLSDRRGWRAVSSEVSSFKMLRLKVSEVRTPFVAGYDLTKSSKSLNKFSWPSSFMPNEGNIFMYSSFNPESSL